MLDNFIFIAFPYIAVSTFFLGCFLRLKNNSFEVSSLSSQFLEGKTLFWGSVPFHFGIIVVFLGHLLAFLIPEATLLWNSQPARLILLEVTGFAFGLSAFFGLMILMLRRFFNPRIWAVTSKMDLSLELILVIQIFLGLWIAYAFRWGSSWFAADLSPYLWSLIKLDPQISAVVAMPGTIKLHIFGAFLILMIFPFTRLVHLLMAPVHYLGRPYQRVIWYWNKDEIRNPKSSWTIKKPKNN